MFRFIRYIYYWNVQFLNNIIIPLLHRRGGYTVLPLSVDIFRRIFLSNYWWQKSDIWSQALYRYPISWEAFFDLSDSYFLFAEERGYHKWASWFFFILFLVCHLLEYCGVIFYSALLLYESYGKVNNVHQTVVQDFPRRGGVGFITVVEFVQSDTWRHPTKNDGPKVKH